MLPRLVNKRLKSVIGQFIEVDVFSVTWLGVPGREERIPREKKVARERRWTMSTGETARNKGYMAGVWVRLAPKAA